MTKPGVVDTMTDLAARYLLLMASETATAAATNHYDNQPTIQDVRLALERVGALRPQMKATEEMARGKEFIDGELVPFEDMRGIRSFIKWCEGSTNREIRRVGGLEGGDTDNVADLAAGIDEKEDYVTGELPFMTLRLLTLAAIKKKHGKTAEESRYQGTTLGKDHDMTPITITGGSLNSVSAWNASRLQSIQRDVSPLRSTSSSPLSTPMDATTPAYEQLSST